MIPLRSSIRDYRVPRYPAPVARGIAMDANTNLLGPNPALLAFLRGRAPKAAYHHYPSPHSDVLRAALARRTGVPVERLVVGNGSDELFDLVVKAFTNPGDRVAFPSPSFVMYGFYARTNLAEPVPVPLDRAFQLDVAAFRRARAAVTFLPSPNNPTGNAFRRRDIEAIVRGSKGVVVVDEAYAEFAGQDCFSGAGRRSNVIVTRTFSKAHGLAGLRVGYATGAAPLVDALYRVKAPFNVSLFSELAAAYVLDRPSFLRRSVRTLVGERERLARGLRALGFAVFPSDSNFLLVRGRRPGDALARDLATRGIRVRGMSDFAGIEDCVRVTVGAPAHNRRLLSALRENARA